MPDSFLDPSESPERQNEKLLRINRALMRRVELGGGTSGAAYAQFQRAALLEEEVDLAIQTGPVGVEEVGRFPLARQTLSALLPDTHPLARRGKPVALRDLLAEPLILREEQAITRQLFDKACAAAGQVPEPAITAGSREAVAAMVAAGLGAGVVLSTEMPGVEALVALPLDQAPAAVDENILWLDRRRGLRLISAFLDLVEEQAGTGADKAL